MERSSLNFDSPYNGKCFIITTKHGKSEALMSPLWNGLGVSVLEYLVDTDCFGTFSGEVERKSTALECAKLKCESALKILGSKADYFIASEGSFGPHPIMPFTACDHEILYFIDKKLGFHFYVSLLSEKTNYRVQELDSLEELQLFANQTNFPSHALVLRPLNSKGTKIFKGLDSQESLEEAFKEVKKISNKLLVETDMRAHMNPSRMKVIAELAENLAYRLTKFCPACKIPGWGKIGVQKGLLCGECKLPTELTYKEIFGCTKCSYQEIKEREDGMKFADPGLCNYCNP